MDKRVLGLLVAVLVSAAGCGGGSDRSGPAASASPSVTVDSWAIKACQNARDGADLAARTEAEESANRDLVDAALMARQTGNIQLIKAWCAKWAPYAGATPDAPKP
jgi:hypothetical protein